MRVIFKFALTLALSFCMLNVLADTTTPANFGVVDMAAIFHDSSQVKSINQGLEKQFSSSRDDIVKMSTNLQNDIQKYQKNKAVMNSNDLNNLKNQITDEESKLRQAQAQFQQKLYEAQNAAMTKFLDQVKVVTQKIAQQKNLQLVLPKNTILYSADNLDITKDVLDQLK